MPDPAITENLWGTGIYWFNREDLTKRDLPLKRKIGWEKATDTLFILSFRSLTNRDGPGHFSVCHPTTSWAFKIVRQGKVRQAYIVAVEEFGGQVVKTKVVETVFNNLFKVVPKVNDDDKNTYLWHDDDLELYDPTMVGKGFLRF